MKKMIALILVMISILSVCSGVFADGKLGTETKYVYTENGGALNVRRDPAVKDGNVIGQLQYGAKVEALVISVPAGWTAIRYSKGTDGVAYVMSRYLVNTEPESKKQKEDEERLRDLEELNRQMSTYKALEEPLTIAVRASRPSGWVNFRVGPGVAADRIASLPDGRELTAIAETAKWYQATDSASGRTGYISKSYVTVIGKAHADEKESLGSLTVNGQFALQCRLPEDYSLQVVNMQGTRIVASILPRNNQKPVMYLSIAYNELYSDLPRLNDMPEEELRQLEESFTAMNDVEITYSQTAYGTKLLVAKEVGDDTDYVDFMTLYRGYSIEFVLTPNPDAVDRTLTQEQIGMCVDFLTELDFVEI